MSEINKFVLDILDSTEDYTETEKKQKLMLWSMQIQPPGVGPGRYRPDFCRLFNQFGMVCLRADRRCCFCSSFTRKLDVPWQQNAMVLVLAVNQFGLPLVWSR